MADYLNARRVGAPFVYQDDIDRFEIVVEDTSDPHTPHFRTIETWTQHKTPSCFARAVHYEGGSMSDALDAQRDRHAWIVRTKQEGGQIVMRPRNQLSMIGGTR